VSSEAAGLMLKATSIPSVCRAPTPSTDLREIAPQLPRRAVVVRRNAKICGKGGGQRARSRMRRALPAVATTSTVSPVWMDEALTRPVRVRTFVDESIV